MCSFGLPNGISRDEATMILLVNVFFPGVGTMIAGCLGTHGGAAICVGILQFFLFPVLIGWIWAICWGFELRKKAIKGRDSREVDEERGSRRGPSQEKQGHSSNPHPYGGQKDYVSPPPPVSHQHGPGWVNDTQGIPSAPYPSDYLPPQVPPGPPSAPPM